MTRAKLGMTILLLGLAALFACSKERTTTPTADEITGDCRDCHTNSTKLKALAVADTSDGGEAGEG